MPPEDAQQTGSPSLPLCLSPSLPGQLTSPLPSSMPSDSPSTVFLLNKADLRAPAQRQGSTLYQVVARSDGYEVTISPRLPPLGEKTC